MTTAHLRLIGSTPIALAPTEAAEEIARLDQIIEGHKNGWHLQDLCSEQLLKVADRIESDQSEYAAGMRHAIGALGALRSPVVITVEAPA